MGNSFCVMRKKALEKHEKMELTMSVLVKDMGNTRELELGHEYCPETTVEDESVVANKQASCRIKVVIKKQQLQELVSKQNSVQDIIRVVQTPEKCTPQYSLSNMYWRPVLESIPEEHEV